jgi:hypothetical protein
MNTVANSPRTRNGDDLAFELVIDLYLWGWIVTTAVTFLAARAFADERYAPPVRSLAGVGVIAGALWPVLAVGVVELGSLVTVSKLRH